MKAKKKPMDIKTVDDLLGNDNDDCVNQLSVSRVVAPQEVREREREMEMWCVRLVLAPLLFV